MASGNMALDVIVRMKDLLSGPARAMGRALEGIGRAAKSIGLVGAAIAGISFLGPIREAAAFQQQLVDIALTQNLTGAAAFKSVAEMTERYEQLALKVGQTSEALGGAGGLMVASGLNTSVVDKSIDIIGKAATAAHADAKDIAQVATSSIQTLKLPVEQLDGALAGMMVSAKEGSFEVRDMAKYFPNLTGQMAKFGITGREAVNTLSAGLQIARLGTADSAEAANNFKNFLSKILSPETTRKFEKMGVDIEGVMKDAATKGINPMEAVVQKITKLTGVSSDEIQNLMKRAKANGLSDADALAQVREQLEKIHGAGALGELFGDQQVMDFLIPFLANIDEYKRIKAEVAKATGEDINGDFETQMLALNQQLTILGETGTQAVREVGLAFGTWLPVINENLTALLRSYREWNKESGGMGTQLVTWAGAAIAAAAGLGVLGTVLPILQSGASLIVGPFRLAGRAVFSTGRYFLLAARNAVALQAALGTMSGASFGGLAQLAVGLRGMVMAIPGVSMLGSALAAIGTAIAGITAPVWGLIAAIIAVALAVHKYWEPISNFAAGFASSVGGALADVTASFASFAGQKLVDLASMLGFTDADISAVLNKAAEIGNGIVEMIKAIPGKVGSLLSELFTMNDYSAAAEAGFRSAGERAGQALVDAVKAAIDGLVAWFASLPDRIMAAIGNIDLTNVITFPSWPGFLGGGDSPPAPEGTPPTPANENQAGAPSRGAVAAKPQPQVVNVNSQTKVDLNFNANVPGTTSVTSAPAKNTAAPASTGKMIGRF